MPAGRLHAVLHAGVAIALLSVAAAACSQAGEVPLPLRTVVDAPLTGRATRWDYASIDPPRHHLFLAHLGDSVVTVVDTRDQRVIADLPDVSHVHGVLAVPELDRVYARPPARMRWWRSMRRG